MDAVEVRLPLALRMYASAAPKVLVDEGTLAGAIAQLDARHPGLEERLLDDQGRVRRHVLVFVNGEAVAHRDPAEVPVRRGDTVHILPSVAGG